MELVISRSCCTSCNFSQIRTIGVGLYATGCFRMTAKKFELITEARKQTINY